MNLQYAHLAWMILAVLVIVYLGSPRYRGEIAFRRVRHLLQSALDPRNSTQFHGVYIPAGGGRERLDHVVVSQSGILVIRSVHRPGEIRGGESQEFWTQTRWGRTRHWPNPVHEGKLQIEALQDFLDLPRNCFRLIVAVSGSQPLRADLPHPVVSVGRLTGALGPAAAHRLTPAQADEAAEALSQKRLQTPGFSRTAIAQTALALLVAAGIYFVFGQDIGSAIRGLDSQLSDPADETPAEQERDRRARYEETLACAFSSDTGRCACYEPGGEKVEIARERCRDLAERGSILER